jgi:hypothetical protein
VSNEIRISGEYYRSNRGDVIHLAPCPSMGGAVRWNYADGKSLHEVANEVNAADWLRLCTRCWPPAALPVPVGDDQ